MPIVNILLCTHDGGTFLDAQLQSFLDQDHGDWRLWVSDDASTDYTREQILTFAHAHPNRDVRLIGGPGQGSAANFLSLLAQKELAGSWVSFADQDDVWMPHKLSCAVSQLIQAEAQGPAVYASRTLLTGPDLMVTGPSPLHPGPYGFGNALVQNVLGGNTIIMPPDTTDLLRETVPAAHTAGVPFHDWWIYLVTTGAGLQVINDTKPSVYYRQHEGNQLGTSLENRIARLRMLRKRVFAGWVDCNIAGLSEVKPLLCSDNQVLFEAFTKWRRTPLINRWQSPQSVGVYRQTMHENLVLRGLARIGSL